MRKVDKLLLSFYKNIIFVFIFILFFAFPVSVFAQEEEYFKGRVTEAIEEQSFQLVNIEVISGTQKGKNLTLNHGELFTVSAEQKVKKGDLVVLTKTQTPDGEKYFITDKYRLPSLGLIFGLFFAFAIFFGRMRGLTSILGLLLTIVIIGKFIVPQIVLGRDPLLISVSGALAIAILSLYMAHGINKRTTISLVSTVITLLIAALLAYVFVIMAALSGAGSEEALFIANSPIGEINLRGLLLGGIIIGALGVLDDITTAQVAAVEEISKANKKLTNFELFSRGISVGREHIASLVNTLVLAYVGASFPLILLFSTQNTTPFWVTANSEFIAEEVIRTLVGSMALIFAVPISTFLASHYFGKKN
jgi:uncharacterized membrane protein